GGSDGIGSYSCSPGFASCKSVEKEEQDDDPQCREQPAHFRFSIAETTTAVTRWPVAFAMVRNMSEMRSSPMRIVRPATGKPVAWKAGSRLMTPPDGTAATVSDARNTAMPAAKTCSTPNGMP